MGITNLSPISKRKETNLFFINCSPLIFKNQPAIKHRNKAFKGINMFAVKKSNKSNIVLSEILKLLKTPKDNAAGIASNDITINNIEQARTLEIFHLSIIDATGTSTMLIPDVIAATKSRMKNAAEIIFPNGIWANIWGMVINTSPAPELGSNPKENIEGKIIIPAKSAKKVSEKIIT